MPEAVSFRRDIRPMFTDMDIEHMRKAIDLSSRDRRVPPCRRDLQSGVKRVHAAALERRIAVDAGDVRDVQGLERPRWATLSRRESSARVTLIIV
jgi:hypothetical protein